MANNLAEKRLDLETQIEAAEDQYKYLNDQFHCKKRELEDLLNSSPQFRVLGEICSSIEKLDEMGVSDLFWGEDTPTEARQARLSSIHEVISDFEVQVDGIKSEQDELQRRRDVQINAIDDLNYLLDEVLDREEAEEAEYVIEREPREMPYRPMLLPWITQKQDQRRFQKSLGGVFIILLMLNLLIAFWQLPKITPEKVEVPEYLVRVVKKEKPTPRPPIHRPKTTKEKIKDVKKVAKSQSKPKAAAKSDKAVRKKAESAGVLAFKDSFNDLLADNVDKKLGASANLKNKAASARGDASRNLVVSQATETSGGINTAKLSHGLGGAAGRQMGTGVSFSRVTSSIGADVGADDRPLSDGVGPSRTDEEIQIVFDRYKAALYRIYNRELRQNPMLKGKMVLRITIQPDGSVSLVKVESTNLQSQALVSEVVARVNRFNFGPKDGVPAVTILYPIDFLPAG